DLFSNHFASMPKAASCLRGNHHHGRPSGLVYLREPPARNERNAHDAEIIGSYYIEPEQWLGRVGGKIRKVFKIERTLVHSPAKWQGVHQRRATNPGGSPGPFQHIAIESQAALRVIAKCLVGRNARGQNLLHLKARVNVRQRPKTTDQKARRNDEQRSEEHTSE